MGAFSVATGVTLLYDEGLLPPNPERQAIAFASPAELAKIEGEGLAMKQTATDLAMEDNSANGTVELSSAAMQFLVQNLAATEAAPKEPASDTVSQLSGYPYAGWSENSNLAEPHGMASGGRASETPATGTAAPAIAPAAAASATAVVAAAPIDLLA